MNAPAGEECPYPTAPNCPHWCSVHRGAAGWDVHPAAVTKTCRRVIECDGGSEVEIEVFASVDAGELHIAPPVVRVQVSGDALGLADALLLAETIARAVEMTAAPAISAVA